MFGIGPTLLYVGAGLVIAIVAGVVLGRLKLVPVRLSTMSEGDVRSTVEARGGVVERVEEHPKRTDGVRSLRYYVRV